MAGRCLASAWVRDCLFVRSHGACSTHDQAETDVPGEGARAENGPSRRVRRTGAANPGAPRRGGARLRFPGPESGARGRACACLRLSASGPDFGPAGARPSRAAGRGAPGLALRPPDHRPPAYPAGVVAAGGGVDSSTSSAWRPEEGRSPCLRGEAVRVRLGDQAVGSKLGDSRLEAPVLTELPRWSCCWRASVVLGPGSGTRAGPVTTRGLRRPRRRPHNRGCRRCSDQRGPRCRPGSSNSRSHSGEEPVEDAAWPESGKSHLDSPLRRGQGPSSPPALVEPSARRPGVRRSRPRWSPRPPRAKAGRALPNTSLPEGTPHRPGKAAGQMQPPAGPAEGGLHDSVLAGVVAMT